MKSFKTIIYLFLTTLTVLLCCCSINSDKKKDTAEVAQQTVSFVTWNTQTFFDGITDGTEYPDFKTSKNWDYNKYETRLERLCKAMEDLNADIFVFQEIEDEAVMRDISNRLAKNTWNKKNMWHYACFAKEKNDAIGNGVFSKYPILDVKCHGIKVKSENTIQPPMRPIIETNINVNNKNLTIFINHWKSKSGGAETSEIWRTWQEALLCQRINQLNNKGINYCIAAGDFNKDIKEFMPLVQQNNTNHYPFYNKNTNILLNGELTKSKNISAHTPWLSNNGNYTTETGSYFYKDSWERIDNIFAIGDIDISDFKPQAVQPFVNEEGIPYRYKYYNGTGYSDHLPLMCNLTF